MGIVNVTPDSFSDGGRFFDLDAAVAQAERLVEEGAEMIDVGGESTRPGAAMVTVEEELRRVIPVIKTLAARLKIPISIDTQKPEVARAALDAGASIVNDIAANREEDGMWRIAAGAGAGYIAMHMQGTPQTMQRQPCYRDVVAEVKGFFTDRMGRMWAAGLPAERVVLDVGIGFGKRYEHNLELLRRLGEFAVFRRPILLGVSRKSFLERFAGDAGVEGRLPGALACACWAVQHGVSILRTHDARATLQAVRMMEELSAQTR